MANEFFCQDSYLEGMRDGIQVIQKILDQEITAGTISIEQAAPFVMMLAGALVAFQDSKEGTN